MNNENIWYNKDRTACLNLDKIGFWLFKGGELTVYIGGSVLNFTGQEAEEIYKKLTSSKQLL